MIKFLAIGILILWSTSALPAENCMPVAKVFDEFIPFFEEMPIGAGKTHGNTMLFLLSERGSYTIFKIYPDGRACFLDWGTDWEILAKPKKGKPT
jgi:hypothetical protein